MRLAALGLFTLATALCSLLEGTAVNMIGFVLTCAGAALIAKRQLLIMEREDQPALRISVVRWNY